MDGVAPEQIPVVEPEPPWGSSWMDSSSMRSMNCSWVTSGAPLSSSSSSRASAAQSLARESSSWAA